MVRILKISGYLPWFASVLIIAACSVQDHYRTLSIFFDGVPNPDRIDQTAIDSATIIIDSTTIFAQNTIPKLNIHHPYLEKECAACHNQGRMGTLNESEPGLCFQCHSNLDIRYNSEHGPAAGGFCTECHNPHKSTEETLLLRKREELCFSCHEEKQVKESLFHNISDETACLACHSPHGSDNHSLLKQGVCYSCHDDFSDQYQALHGPVAMGRCSECHTPHTKGSDKLLVKKGRDLCFNCHNAGRLLKSDTHSYIEDADCMECHNPHGGEDRFLFY